MPVTNNKGAFGHPQPRPTAPATHIRATPKPIPATAKRQKVQALLVSASHGEEVLGLEVLLGRFEVCGSRQNAGYPVYEKVEASASQPHSEPCFLYFWTDEGDPSQDGWWFGDEVGGAMVYCVNPQAVLPPPVSGWRLPAEDGGPEIECLRVEPVPTGPTSTPRQPRNAPLKGSIASASSSDVAKPTMAARNLIEEKLDEWVSAKRDRQFTRADHIRQELQAEGIEPEVERADMKLMRESTRSPAASPTSTESLAADKGSKGRIAMPLKARSGVTSRPSSVAPREPPKVENCQRYSFTEENAPVTTLLGLAISSAFPPVIESVIPNTAAHHLRIPVNRIIHAVNGEVVKAGHSFKDSFSRRPLYLDVKSSAATAAGVPAGGKCSGKGGWRPDAATASNAGPQVVLPPAPSNLAQLQKNLQQAQKHQQAPQAPQTAPSSLAQLQKNLQQAQTQQQAPQAPQTQSAQDKAAWAQQMLAATLGPHKPQQGPQRAVFGQTAAAVQGTSSAGGVAPSWGANGASQQLPVRPQQPPTAVSRPASGGTAQAQPQTAGFSFPSKATAPAGEESHKREYKWQQVREGACQRLAIVAAAMSEDEVETWVRVMDICQKEKANGGVRTHWNKMQFIRESNPPAEQRAGGGKGWSSSQWGQMAG